MNDTVMREAFSLLADDAIAFICAEFRLSEEEFNGLDEDALVDLYESLCDIEVEETPDNGAELSDRAKMVESIITIVGRYFSDKLGYADNKESE